MQQGVYRMTEYRRTTSTTASTINHITQTGKWKFIPCINMQECKCAKFDWVIAKNAALLLVSISVAFGMKETWSLLRTSAAGHHKSSAPKSKCCIHITLSTNLKPHYHNHIKRRIPKLCPIKKLPCESPRTLAIV